MAPYRIVFIRHGESVYNEENRFCGWHDADLSGQGITEAKQAGQLLHQNHFTFDIAYTSVLKRAIKTLNLVLDELDLNWIPVMKTWRLNERMYGALQGLNKSETAAKHGEEQVKIWRRAYDIPPPPVDTSDPRFPGNEPKYAVSIFISLKDIFKKHYGLNLSYSLYRLTYVPGPTLYRAEF
ncbi:unnamed protein product [Schistosoma curassoni]|uniref:phosphoglycerate mutase (2,3-diphosphoglycerate-dependent) n=1 Tax=Schistosoma curassoni TaxID=6186 RepID=A0A183L033_9TREM|nr:unnamed protein product [Schistosoma curassoni]